MGQLPGIAAAEIRFVLLPHKPYTHFFRPHPGELAVQEALVREILALATEVLSVPVSDTFLGRKTQEPFPQEEE